MFLMKTNANHLNTKGRLLNIKKVITDVSKCLQSIEQEWFYSGVTKVLLSDFHQGHRGHCVPLCRDASLVFRQLLEFRPS